LLLGFLFRLAPLKRYVTPDEPAWVYRAIRFSDALAARDWGAVPSTGHPGVTTMWLGAAGVAVRRLLDPARSAEHLRWIRQMAWLAPENDAAFRHLAFFLGPGRVAVALATTLGLGLTYVLIRRLYGAPAALLGVGLLLFEPFLVGHSGLLHTDALLATCTTLSLLGLLIAAREEVRYPGRWAAFSGVAAGLALLSKSLAVVLLPFAGLVLGSSGLGRRRRFPAVLALGLVWVLSGALTYALLFPAMWHAPLHTLQDLFVAPAYQSTTALMPTFFAGRMALRHGPQFYAAALPLRLGPVLLIGALLSARTFRRRPALRLELGWLWLFVLGYVLLLATNAKKYDRYLLPTWGPLATLAGLALASTLSRRTVARWAVVGAQVLLLLPFVAHPLGGFNWLLGGPWVGGRVLSADWGAGMGAAARWLDRRPDAETLTVAALSVPSFAPLFRGRTVPLAQASRADYVVTRTNEGYGPVAQRVRLSLLEHALVSTNTVPLEQAALLERHAADEDLILLDAETPLLRRYPGPGTVTTTAQLGDAPALVQRVRALSAGRDRLWCVSDPAASPIARHQLREALALLATPVATYTAGGATITAYDPHAAPSSAGAAPLVARFDGGITLLDVALPQEPVADAFPVALRWQVATPTDTALHSSLRLEDAAGRSWAEVGYPVLNAHTFPTTDWAPGEWADQTLRVPRPARLPPGEYALRLVLTDAAGAQRGVWNAAAEFQGVRLALGSVRVRPPTQPAGAPPCDAGRRITVTGDLRACAPAQALRRVPSGDTLTAALTWWAEAPLARDYRVVWRLRAAGAVVHAWEAPLAPHATSNWRAGDSFEVRYAIPISPTLRPGAYRLTFNVLNPAGDPAWAADEPFTSLEVEARERAFDLPATMDFPLDARLGERVRLRGLDVESDTVAPGAELGLTLYWQAEGPTDVDYTVFVHLVGPDGQIHGQVDRPPAAGGAPTTSWAPGQVVVDELALPVAPDAPPGRYHLRVGMYDAASGGRLPVRDATGDPLPDEQLPLPIEIEVQGGDA
jgi:methionine-rich copper-binding protein CopC